MKKLITTFTAVLFALFTAFTASAQSLTADNVTGEEGSTVDLTINLNNGDLQVTTLQFDLYLPEGVTLQEVMEDDEVSYVANFTSRKADHTASIKLQDDGAYRFLIMSMSNKVIKGTEGPLMTIPVELNAAPGTYEIQIEKIELVDPSFNKINPASTSATLTITEAEIVEYEDFQFYAYTTKVNQGEKASMKIYFNAVGKVSYYSFDIQLPTGLKVEMVEDEGEQYENIEFAETIKNFIQDYEYDDEAGIISMISMTTKNAVYPASNDLFATIVFDTETLAPGEYTVVFKDQSVTSSGTTYTPSDFEAKIVVEGDASEITLQHGVDYTRTENAENVTVNYVRTFAHTAWQGLYLPFDVAYDDWKDLGSVAVLNAVSGTAEEPVLEWKVIDRGTLQANTPCIFQPAQAGEMTLTAEDVTLYAAPAINGSVSCSGEGSTFTVTGIYTKKTDMATSGAYGLINGVFRPTDDNSHTLNPYLIYLTIASPAGAPARIATMIQNPDGSTSMIEDIEYAPATDGACYDLLGRKAVNPANGIYIVNGTKVLINK